MPVVDGIFPQAPAQIELCAAGLCREVDQPRLRITDDATDLLQTPQQLCNLPRLRVESLLARGDLVEHTIPGVQALPENVQALFQRHGRGVQVFEAGQQRRCLFKRPIGLVEGKMADGPHRHRVPFPL